jgi:hypothetical protein
VECFSISFVSLCDMSFVWGVSASVLAGTYFNQYKMAVLFDLADLGAPHLLAHLRRYLVVVVADLRAAAAPTVNVARRRHRRSSRHVMLER